MDHAWAVEQLNDFRTLLDDYFRLDSYGSYEYEPQEEDIRIHDDLIDKYGPGSAASDLLISRNPIIRQLMEAAQAGLADYPEPPEDGWDYGVSYWSKLVLPRVLRAIGIHEFGEEAQRRLKPDSPDLAADQFHPWVREAASPLWHAGSRQEAVHAAARSVNARMQQNADAMTSRMLRCAANSSALKIPSRTALGFGSRATAPVARPGAVSIRGRWSSARAVSRPYETLPRTSTA
jgi:hypothetical protein